MVGAADAYSPTHLLSYVSKPKWLSNEVPAIASTFRRVPYSNLKPFRFSNETYIRSLARNCNSKDHLVI